MPTEDKGCQVSDCRLSPDSRRRKNYRRLDQTFSHIPVPQQIYLRDWLNDRYPDIKTAVATSEEPVEYDEPFEYPPKFEDWKLVSGAETVRTWERARREAKLRAESEAKKQSSPLRHLPLPSIGSVIFFFLLVPFLYLTFNLFVRPTSAQMFSVNQVNVNRNDLAAIQFDTDFRAAFDQHAVCTDYKVSGCALVVGQDGSLTFSASIAYRTGPQSDLDTNSAKSDFDGFIVPGYTLTALEFVYFPGVAPHTIGRRAQFKYTKSQ